MNITFADNVPQWLRRIIRREVKRMRIEWRLTVLMADGAAIQDRCAIALMETEYRRADLVFHAGLRNDAEAIHAVKHELLHMALAPIQRHIEQALPRRMPGRRIILKQVDDLIETAIEELLRFV